ncbi:MAG: hypothetical protein KGJ87_09190 [Planctomycetota bacterium]|nr:hypothetical protein [Planctomycetota bacterium]
MVQDKYAPSKRDKILLVISQLEQKRKPGRKITVENLAVALWKKYPSEFSMRGYPQYPNVDIQKNMTKLFTNKLIAGGVHDYSITQKGMDYIKNLKSNGKTLKLPDSSIIRRDIEAEIKRIFNSKVFNYYMKTPNPKFVESDFFDFIGTSSRSLTSFSKSMFLAKYNTIAKEVIPLCKKNRTQDRRIAMIVDLWEILFKKFGHAMEDRIK